MSLKSHYDRAVETQHVQVWKSAGSHLWCWVCPCQRYAGGMLDVRGAWRKAVIHLLLGHGVTVPGRSSWLMKAKYNATSGQHITFNEWGDTQ